MATHLKDTLITNAQHFLQLASTGKDFDWSCFKRMTAVMFDLAHKLRLESPKPNWAEDLMAQIADKGTRALRKMSGIDAELAEEQVSLIEDIMYYFNECEAPFDLDTIEMLAKE